MATFTLLVWLAALGMFIWLSKQLLPHLWEATRRGDDNGAFGLSIFIVTWLIIVFGITSALVSDIYGVTLGGDSIGEFISWWIPVVVMGESLPSGIARMPVLFTAGLVALGTSSVVALAYNVFKGRENYYYSSSKGLDFGNIGSFVIQGIGLVASILGIISFYLEFFR